MYFGTPGTFNRSTVCEAFFLTKPFPHEAGQATNTVGQVFGMA